MNLDEAREIVLQLLRTKGKARNSEMLHALGGETGLLEQVREDLLFNDVAEDKKGVGLIYIGPAGQPELLDKQAVAAPITTRAPVEAITAAESQPPISCRIFLSYGHDEHAGLARRLKQDLEGRGHEVWFDEERLLPGADWETRIERGLEWVAAESKVGRVVLLMTPYSVRRPNGYCLNELARALGRGLPVVPVMVVWCEPPLSICRIQWLDMQDCVPIDARQARYETRFVQLARALERDDLALEGVHAKLRALLNPLPFDADISHHLTRFVGRQWVFDRIDAWLRDPVASRVFWITGAPGVGKTAIAAWLCEHRPEVVAFHLCRHGHVQKSDPRRCVLSIAYQLSTQLADYQDRLNHLDLKQVIPESDARTLFDRLIVQPLSANFPRPKGSVVVLIDALDEATAGGRNELASFLATEFRRTPDWLRLVITSRPDPEVMHPLQAYTPHVLNASSRDNEDDLRAFLRRELKPFTSGGGAVSEAVIEAILARSDGIFLYVEWVRQEVAAGQLSPAELGKFPKGLGEVYAQYIARQFPDTKTYKKEIAPAFDAIAAAREPLDLSMLAALLGWGERRRHEFQQSLGSLFTSSGGRILPFHKSVLDWLTNAENAGPYFVSIEEGHQALAMLCWDQYRCGLPATSPYALAHLPAHLIAAGRWDDLERLLCDVFYLEAKIQAGRVFELAGDFAVAVASLPEGRPRAGILHLLQKAILRDIHFLAKHPTTLFQCLWNTCWWHDCPEVADHYESGGGGDARPPAGTVPSPLGLFRLLEEWRLLKVRANAGGGWLRALRPPPDQLETPLLGALTGHDDTVQSLAASSDGAWIVSGGCDRTVRLWDASTSRPVLCLREHEGPVHSVAFSPDGRFFASGATDGMIYVWAPDSGTRIRNLIGHDGGITGLAISPDSRWIASSSLDGTVRLWDAETGSEVCSLCGHRGSVWCVAFHPSGHQLVSGGLDKTVRVWQVPQGKPVICCQGHRAWVTSVVFSQDGQRIFSGSLDKSIRVWHSYSGRELARLDGHTEAVTAICLTNAPQHIISGSADKTIRVWNVETGNELACLRGQEGRICALAHPLHCGWFASGGAGRRIVIWNLDARESRRLRGHVDGILCLAFSPDGRVVASGSYDKTVRLWSPNTGLETNCLRGHFGWVTCLAFSPDGRHLASGSWDKTARIWDVTTGRECLSLRGHDRGLRGLSFSPDGSHLDTWTLADTRRSWQLDFDKPQDSLRSREIAPGDPTGGSLTAERGDQEVKVYSAAAGGPVAWFPASAESVVAHPDGHTWAAARNSSRHLYLFTWEAFGGERSES